MNMQAFNFELHAVRVTMLNDAPWFVAADICKALDITNSRDAVGRLDDDEKGVVTTDTLGGQQSVLTVNEPGLYSLVLTSRKPEAKRFKRWITHEVLPALRNTGRYQMPSMPADPRELGLPDFRNPAVAAIAYGEALLKAQAAEATVHRLEVQVAANAAELSVTKPKADALDRLARADGAVNLQTAGKVLGQGPNKFVRWLKTWALHYRGRNLVPYQSLVAEGHFEVKMCQIGDEAYPQTLVTPKGMTMLARRLAKSEAVSA